MKSRKRPPARAARGGGARGKANELRALRERAERSELHQTATFRISEAAQTSGTLHELYAAIHRIVGELMPARNFYIALHDPESGEISFPYSVDEFDLQRAPRRGRKGLTEYVLSTGKPLLATPEEFADLVRRGDVEPSGATAVDWLGVPLAAGGRAIGVLAVQTYEQGVRYRESDLELLQFVSAQVGMAIERKRGEEALRESEATLQVFINAVPEPALLLDAEGTVVASNRAMAERIGGDPIDIVGRHLYGLLPRDVAASRRREISAVVETRKAAVFEDSLGGRSYVNHVYPVLDAAGRVSLLAVFALDVTDRVRLEGQLRQAQKMEAVGRLAGGVAHDFNNLLTAISSYSELLLADLAPEDPRRADVVEIRKATERAAALTRQLLAFSRRQVLQPKVVDLNAVIAGAEKLLRRLIGEDVALVTRLAPGLASVKADAGQIEQVIMNLAVNARDAMQGGGTLTLETETVDIEASVQTAEQSIVAPGRYVLLRVGDTGAGMDAETKRHLFEPFFTTKERGRGTGLGLATVYGIVKQSEGFIWVDSEPGKGSLFRIYLPAQERAARPAEAAERPESQPAPGTETILLVEDEDAVRAVTRESLRRRGYAVLVAPNAEAALEVSGGFDGRIALLLTDVVMPGMSGRALADRLASRRPETKVLYMSGYTGDAIVQHGVLEPGLHYLQKPFTPDILATRVRQVLDTST